MKNKQRQKQEKRKKQRVFFSIIMILFTGIILTASTYAWFTSNRNTSVKDIDVNVTASTGFQISADADEWKSILSFDDLKGITYTGGHNRFPTEVAPVSTIGDVSDTNGFMQMYIGTVTDEEGASYLKSELLSETYATPVVSNGNFIAFDLYFRSGTASDVFLAKGSKVGGKGTDSGIKNASRVGFIVEGNTDYASEASTAQGLQCSNETDSVAPCTTSLIWEPNATSHTAAAVSHGKKVYGITTDATNSDLYDADGNAKVLPYKGVKTVFDKVAVNSTSSDNFATPANLRTTKLDFATAITGANVPAFHINAGITKVRVYMWVEGQDIDCEDNAASTATTTKGLQFNLAFSLDNE